MAVGPLSVSGALQVLSNFSACKLLEEASGTSGWITAVVFGRVVFCSWPCDYDGQAWMRSSITLPCVLNAKNKAPQPAFLCQVSIERNWLLLQLFFPLTGLPCQDALQTWLGFFLPKLATWRHTLLFSSFSFFQTVISLKNWFQTLCEMNHSCIRVSLTPLMKAIVASQLSHRICNDFFPEQFFHLRFS